MVCKISVSRVIPVQAALRGFGAKCELCRACPSDDIKFAYEMIGKAIAKEYSERARPVVYFIRYSNVPLEFLSSTVELGIPQC